MIEANQYYRHRKGGVVQIRSTFVANRRYRPKEQISSRNAMRTVVRGHIQPYDQVVSYWSASRRRGYWSTEKRFLDRYTLSSHGSNK